MTGIVRARYTLEFKQEAVRLVRGGQLRSIPNSRRHASESWHPAFAEVHADTKLDPSFRWGDGTVGAQVFQWPERALDGRH